ncbi:MAG: tetratricopeptide repeat protein [Candidatus Hermodarchaeota archaeon]
MKLCPYCNSPIQENWSYCRNCNKPLLVNLEDVLNGSVRFPYDELETYHLDMEEDEQEYETTIIQDEEIDQKIKKIDETIDRKEILGEPISGTLFLEKSGLYYKKRDLTNASKNLESAIKVFKDENDLLNEAICHNELGIIHEDNGLFDQAIYHFNRSLEILEELEDNSKIIKIFNNLGNIYFLLKDLENSYQYYQKAFELSKQEKLIFDEVKSSSNLVEVLYLLKDYDRIRKILERNLEFFKEREDIYGIIQTEIKYGKLYYLMNEDYDQSYHFLTNALELIKRLGENISVYIKARLEWECYLYLGKIYYLRDNNTKAENLFLQSLEAVRVFEIGDNIKEGEILENLAELYLSKGDTKRAIDYFDLSREIFYKFGDNIKNAELKFKIGKIFLEYEEDKIQAINNFEESLEVYEELEYFKESAVILQKLGDIYLTKGIIETAVSYFERACNFYQKIQDEYNVKLITEKIKSLDN